MLRIPPTDYMSPRQVYVGRLPGDTRPSFVRKHQPTICDRIGKAIASYQSPPASNKMMSWSVRNFYPKVQYDCYPRRRKYWGKAPNYVVPDDIDVGRLATSVAQVCAACGKHRSPGWSSRHPLTPGGIAKPALCRKCRYKSTSSEGSGQDRCGHKRRRRHRQHYDTSSEEEARYWRKASRRPRSHSCHHRRGQQLSSSHDSVNVCIDNSPRFQNVQPMVRGPVREPTSDSVEEVRVRHRSLPPQQRRTFVVDDLDSPPPHRHSFHERIHVGRHSSLRRSHPRPTRRSSHHVSFVDTSDEFLSPRSRSPRWRPVYYDGANSGESESHEMAQAPSVEEPESEFEEFTPMMKRIEAIPPCSLSDAPSYLSFRERAFRQGRGLPPDINISSKDAGSEQSTRSRSSSPDRMTRSLSTSHPDHPDHLIWLLATQRLGPEEPHNSDVDSIRDGDVSSVLSPPLSPMFDEDSFEKSTPASSFESSAGHDRRHFRREVSHDDDESWAAQGRAHMESLRKQHYTNYDDKDRHIRLYYNSDPFC